VLAPRTLLRSASALIAMTVANRDRHLTPAERRQEKKKEEGMAKTAVEQAIRKKRHHESGEISSGNGATRRGRLASRSRGRQRHGARKAWRWLAA